MQLVYRVSLFLVVYHASLLLVDLRGIPLVWHNNRLSLQQIFIYNGVGREGLEEWFLSRVSFYHIVFNIVIYYIVLLTNLI